MLRHIISFLCAIKIKLLLSVFDMKWYILALTCIFSQQIMVDRLQESGRKFTAYMTSDGSEISLHNTCTLKSPLILLDVITNPWFVIVTGLSTSFAASDQIASVQLPPSLFDQFGDSEDHIGLVFTVYAEPVLFPLANTTQTRSEIRSPVIGAVVAGAAPIDNLIEPVEIGLTHLMENNVSVFQCPAMFHTETHNPSSLPESR